MRRLIQNYCLCTITALGVVILDLWSKKFWFAREEMWTGLAPLLQTIHHRNYGLMFNLPAPTWMIVGVSGLVLLAVIVLFGRKLAWWPMAIGLGLLIGGALGNGYDRIAFGFVRDWILAFGRSAFNVADIAIGAGLLLLFWYRDKKVDEFV
ncbi:signal peptidase II [Patescibacteria group bacterium]|nr:signal peptidase II [Patescibacteria group bacterium]MBP9709845.1 signal peptidase II [Patescibacteria group bacterium]